MRLAEEVLPLSRSPVDRSDRRPRIGSLGRPLCLGLSRARARRARCVHASPPLARPPRVAVSSGKENRPTRVQQGGSYRAARPLEPVVPDNSPRDTSCVGIGPQLPLEHSSRGLLGVCAKRGWVGRLARRLAGANLRVVSKSQQSGGVRVREVRRARARGRRGRSARHALRARARPAARAAGAAPRRSPRASRQGGATSR